MSMMLGSVLFQIHPPLWLTGRLAITRSPWPQRGGACSSPALLPGLRSILFSLIKCAAHWGHLRSLQVRITGKWTWAAPQPGPWVWPTAAWREKARTRVPSWAGTETRGVWSWRTGTCLLGTTTVTWCVRVWGRVLWGEWESGWIMTRVSWCFTMQTEWWSCRDSRRPWLRCLTELITSSLNPCILPYASWNQRSSRMGRTTWSSVTLILCSAADILYVQESFSLNVFCKLRRRNSETRREHWEDLLQGFVQYLGLLKFIWIYLHQFIWIVLSNNVKYGKDTESFLHQPILHENMWVCYPVNWKTGPRMPVLNKRIQFRTEMSNKPEPCKSDSSI